MIGLALENSSSTIDLFHKKKTDHLMRKSHFGQRDFFVGSVVDFLRKTISAAYQKMNFFYRISHPEIYFLRELTAGKLFAFFIQNNNKIRSIDMVLEKFRFLFL